MKAKVTRNVSVRSTLDYVQQTTKHHERIAGNVISAHAEQQAREFKALEQVRPDIEKPTWHASLSLPPGEHLDAERWRQVCDDFMAGMGLETHLWVAVRHQDCAHDHVHIVASRIGFDGQVWLGQHEARRAMALTSELEGKHGLQQTKSYPDFAHGRKQLSKNEIEMSLRCNSLAPRAALQGAIDGAIVGRPGLIEFVDRLESVGIAVRVNSTSSGHVSGLSYSINSVCIKSSQLGKAYGWSNLQKGLNHDQDRDGRKIAEWAAARNAADVATRGAADYPGPALGGGAQSHRNPTRLDSRESLASATTSGSGWSSDEGSGSALADLNCRREAFSGNGSRQRVRGTGTGAVASASRRAKQAELVEIRPRRRPVSGAAARLVESLALLGNSDLDSRRSANECDSNCAGVGKDCSRAAATGSGAVVSVTLQKRYDRER